MVFLLKTWIYRMCRRFDTSRNQLVSEMILLREGVWLDAGCGDGELFNLRRDFSGYKVGAELFESPLLKAQKRGFPDCGFVRFDMEDPLPFRNATLDLVTCSSVLQYVDRIPQALEEVYRVLKPGGCFIFEVPNFAAFYRRYEALKGEIPETGYMPLFRGGVKTQFTARLIEEDMVGEFNRKLGAGRGFVIRSRKTAGIFSRFRDVVWPTFLGSEFAYALEKRI